MVRGHPGVGLDKIDDLKKASAYFVGKDNLVTVFQWAKQTYGFREEKVKPYSFNPAPFLADKKSVQQGYLTSEPYEVEKQGGFKPNVFLVADYGYDSYSTTIETRAPQSTRLKMSRPYWSVPKKWMPPSASRASGSRN